MFFEFANDLLQMAEKNLPIPNFTNEICVGEIERTHQLLKDVRIQLIISWKEQKSDSGIFAIRLVVLALNGESRETLALVSDSELDDELKKFIRLPNLIAQKIRIHFQGFDYPRQLL